MTVITLSSDIGQKDYLVAAIRGRLLACNAQWQLENISHDISPFNYNEAAYFIKNACFHFPAFSWHLVLVNVYEEKTPRFLVAYFRNMYFVCPDNGLLPMIFDGYPTEVIRLPLPASKPGDFFTWIDSIGSIILKIEQGAAFHILGEEPSEVKVKNNLKPSYGNDWIEGHIIFIDRFENVITNITQTDFEQVGRKRRFVIEFKLYDTISQLSNHYGEVSEGDKLAFFNSAGHLEIAVNKGNAAGLFGLEPASTNVSKQLSAARSVYRNVRIKFLS